jgi:hypothetical protein
MWEPPQRLYVGSFRTRTNAASPVHSRSLLRSIARPVQGMGCPGSVSRTRALTFETVQRSARFAYQSLRHYSSIHTDHVAGCNDLQGHSPHIRERPSALARPRRRAYASLVIGVREEREERVERLSHIFQVSHMSCMLTSLPGI